MQNPKLVVTPDDDEDFSALGPSPTCDVCGWNIKAGDRVIQTFVGTVKTLPYTDETYELVVTSDTCKLVHLHCLETK